MVKVMPPRLHILMGPWKHTHTFSPLAESFLVLMILAAYSWPVQSLTQRRTTEKAPLGNKDRGQEGGDGFSFVSIKGASQLSD